MTRLHAWFHTRPRPVGYLSQAALNGHRHPVAVLETPPASYPGRSSPYLDPAKRLEAYLAAEGVPLELPADECYVVTHQSHLLSDRATRQREPLRVLLRLRSRDQCHGAVALVGFEVLAIISEMPRHTLIPG